jgi:hypothetical protein
MQENKNEGDISNLMNDDFAHRHEYDIDVFEILDKLYKQYSEKEWNSDLQKQLMLEELVNIENSLIIDAEENGIGLIRKSFLRNYILPPTSKLYPFYLGWKILTMDPYKIGLMLTWQYEKFKNNNDCKDKDFVEIIEFNVHGFIKDHNFLNEDKRLYATTSWLETQKLSSAKKLDPEGNNDVRPVVKFKSKSFAKKVCNDLLTDKMNFFPEITDHQKLKDLIIDGRDIEDICFRGQKNQLPDFFKRLHKMDKLKVNDKKVLAIWIVKSFIVKLKNNKKEKLSFTSVWKILKSKKSQVLKDKRILRKLYPSISPDILKKQ